MTLIQGFGLNSFCQVVSGQCLSYGSHQQKMIVRRYPVEFHLHKVYRKVNLIARNCLRPFQTRQLSLCDFTKFYRHISSQFMKAQA